MKTIIPKIFYLLAGVIGGIVALIIAVVFEIILSYFGKPALTLAATPVLLFTLLFPAIIEELAKTAVAKRLLSQYGDLWTVIGTGAGFGLAETYLSQSAITLQFSSLLLPAVHLVFLVGGYLIAVLIRPGGKSLYWEWLLAATLLHWGYNVSQVLFLLKT